jgi:hypothetical protein
MWALDGVVRLTMQMRPFDGYSNEALARLCTVLPTMQAIKPAISLEGPSYVYLELCHSEIRSGISSTYD